MTSQVFPVLSGLTFDVVRTPIWETDVQRALSGKRSTVANMGFPLTHFELTFSILRDDISVSDFRAIIGLFNNCKGQYDTFLFTDPDFNTTTGSYIATTDGVTLQYQTVVALANNGGAFGQEMIQNINGTPFYFIQRYAQGFYEYLVSTGARSQFCLYSADYTQSAWVKTNVAIAVSTVVAPDGTFADRLNDSSNSNVVHSVAQFFPGTTAAGVYTFSVFVWTGSTEANYIALTVSDNLGGGVNAYFNANTGATISTSVSGSVISGPVIETAVVNSSWNRLSIAFTSSGTSASFSAFVQPQQVAGTGSYAGTSGAVCAVIWGAQFENVAMFPPGSSGAYPSMYLPTTSATITQQDLTVGTTGIITLANTSNLGQLGNLPIFWSGSWYYRCAFDEDKLDVTKFMNKWWQIKKLPFTSIKL